MTTITAKIVADSMSPDGIRLTTMLLRYPRCIHSEFMTHRVFSRNASSSRAIPVERLIKDVMDDPFVPLHWGANQRGMQATKECDEPVMLGLVNYGRVGAWLVARDRAVEVARSFSEAGYHKQIVNRLLEPFSHINVVVTATEWSNFFALRAHPDAEPHIRLLAERMAEAQRGSEPEPLGWGDWHLPFVTEPTGTAQDILVSVARCARTSYLTHEGKPSTPEEDIKLAERLLGSVPLHASPAEHQATPDRRTEYPPFWEAPRLHGNLVGWVQYRKTLEGESS